MHNDVHLVICILSRRSSYTTFVVALRLNIILRRKLISNVRSYHRYKIQIEFRKVIIRHTTNRVAAMLHIQSYLLLTRCKLWYTFSLIATNFTEHYFTDGRVFKMTYVCFSVRLSECAWLSVCCQVAKKLPKISQTSKNANLRNCLLVNNFIQSCIKTRPAPSKTRLQNASSTLLIGIQHNLYWYQFIIIIINSRLIKVVRHNLEQHCIHCYTQ